MLKKMIALLLCAACLLPLCACVEGSGGDRIKIVCTIFPEYDWVREVLGENPGGAELTLLLDNGVDLHSFQPTADDMIAISSCDLFVYVGGESDSWVKDALRDPVNPDRRELDLLGLLGERVKMEETVEGMQAEEEEEEAPDEHVWLSLRNAAAVCRAIASELGAIDPENKAVYERNAAAYTEKLDALDLAYQKAAEEGERKTLLFADRFPFRYLVEDYGLSYYAAFAGCSSESNASFETIIFLAGKVDELSLGAVLTTEKNDRRIAEAVIGASKSKGAGVLSLDSMQSAVGKGEKTYYSIMEENLEVLKLALRAGAPVPGDK